LAKVGKDYSMLIYVLHYAVLQALSRCFKGRRSLLAMGYQQYGMMFVFAVTVVMVAVYVNARACLKNHSRKL
jgi:predicted Co/Zn/Cd cation transporter (cation efflux family)